MRIGPLRQRMTGDMTARHFGEKAQRHYIRCIKSLAAFIGRAVIGSNALTVAVALVARTWPKI
jgi:hypothetical protein